MPFSYTRCYKMKPALVAVCVTEGTKVGCWMTLPVALPFALALVGGVTIVACVAVVCYFKYRRQTQ